MNRIIRMILTRVLRRGIGMGIDRYANRGRRPEDMTQEERARARNTRQTANRARRMLRFGRRF